MKSSEPRIKPLADDQLDDEARRVLERAKMQGRVLNIFRTLAHHPKLLVSMALNTLGVQLDEGVPGFDL